MKSATKCQSISRLSCFLVCQYQWISGRSSFFPLFDSRMKICICFYSFGNFWMNEKRQFQEQKRKAFPNDSILFFVLEKRQKRANELGYSPGFLAIVLMVVICSFCLSRSLSFRSSDLHAMIVSFSSIAFYNILHVVIVFNQEHYKPYHGNNDN